MDYELMRQQLFDFVSGESDKIANLANASALFMMSMENLNWAGFYLVKGRELVLGPFQGKPACIRIPFGKGVCGTAAETDCPQVVKDVHLFPGHIACDGASRSEIVLPIHSGGRTVGVLDMDSPLEGRFTEEDREGLQECVRILEDACDWM